MNDFKTPVELKDDEELILEVRHYFFVFLPHLIIGFLIMVIDFFLLYFLFRQGIWGIVIFVIILAISLFYLFRVVFFWKKNYIIITSRRIIDNDRQGFFQKKVSEIPFEKVNNVLYSSKGMWQHLLKYGNIEIQLIGSEKPLIIYNIKDPEDIQKLLNELIEKFLKTEPNQKQADFENPRVREIVEQIKSFEKTEQKKIYNELKKSLFPKQESGLVKKEKDEFLEGYWKRESI